jgi:hypothetical protein
MLCVRLIHAYGPRCANLQRDKQAARPVRLAAGDGFCYQKHAVDEVGSVAEHLKQAPKPSEPSETHEEQYE